MSNIDKQIKVLQIIINITMLVIGFFCGIIYEREFNPTNINETHIDSSVTDNPLDNAEKLDCAGSFWTASEQTKGYASLMSTANKQVDIERPRIGKLVDYNNIPNLK